eukprot:jgi/Chrzof1/7082/Cz02g10060.t1
MSSILRSHSLYWGPSNSGRNLCGPVHAVVCKPKAYSYARQSSRRHHGDSICANAATRGTTLDAIASDLPIRECIAEVLTGLDRSNNMVLQAPPGAGKTTVVPLALLLHNPDYLKAGAKIMVLEPRRVAAKAAARRMAGLLGEEVGQTVGYRVRLETRVSSQTRVEVVTEGILMRMMQHDPGLEGVGAVLFDEFHERNLDSDLALALCLDAQQWMRPELRLLVMSATLGGGLAEDLQQLMMMTNQQQQVDGAESEVSQQQQQPQQQQQQQQQQSSATAVPLVISEGRSYPVSTVYLGAPLRRERWGLERAVSDAVMAAVHHEDNRAGDVLVFLPGVGEIHRLQQLLIQEGLGPRKGFEVLILHGNLSPAQQDDIIRPRAKQRSGVRRIILSTPIAESSITLDGVTIVVDSGYRRSPAYDVNTGINRLRTVFISAASAEQRRGRAGRTGPGVCYRLWDADDDLEESTPPEILDADLAPLALQLAAWGSPDGASLAFLDPPDPDRLATARDLLLDLGAVDRHDKVTDEGQLPVD